MIKKLMIIIVTISLTTSLIAKENNTEKIKQEENQKCISDSTKKSDIKLCKKLLKKEKKENRLKKIMKNKAKKAAKRAANKAKRKAKRKAKSSLISIIK